MTTEGQPKPFLRPDEMTPSELTCLMINTMNAIIGALNSQKPILRADIQPLYDRLGIWVSGFPESQVPDLPPAPPTASS